MCIGSRLRVLRGFWAESNFKWELNKKTDANPTNFNPTLSQILTLPFRHPFPQLPRHKRELSPNKTPHRVSHAKHAVPTAMFHVCMGLVQYMVVTILSKSCNAFYLPGSPGAA